MLFQPGVLLLDKHAGLMSRVGLHSVWETLVVFLLTSLHTRVSVTISCTSYVAERRAFPAAQRSAPRLLTLLAFHQHRKGKAGWLDTKHTRKNLG